MKKSISFILIVLLCLSVFGCGGKDNAKSVEEQLEVYWEAQVTEKDSVFIVGYVFDAGEVGAIIELKDKNNPSDTMRISNAYGTYEITEDKIIIDWDGKDYHVDAFKMTPDHELTYKYKNGDLRLFTTTMQVGGDVLELKPVGTIVN